MENLQAIKQNIQTIRISSNSVKELTQQTAVMILERVKEHGDASEAINLINALGKGARYTALKNWFEYGGLSFYKDKQKKQRVRVKTRPLPSTIQYLKETCWTSFKHEDEEVDEVVKAKRAFLNAVKWLDKYPDLAKECGLSPAQLEELNNAA
jgi:hypothetical protein